MTPRRVLVVDDDRMMAQTLSEIFQLKGWQVTTVFDGHQAVAAVESSDFDVVLMDIKMPGMDGVSAFKAIKACRPALKVVLMTAYAAQELIAEAEREGVMRILPKPVNVPALLALLADSLNERKPILLIDSDEVFLKTMSEVLRLRGYDTVVAQGLNDAARILSEERPAAVLLHMHLGTATARDAVFAVHSINPAVALILYSGQPGAEDEIDGGVPAQWVHAYLQKPFAVEQVTGVLDEIGAR